MSGLPAIAARCRVVCLFLAGVIGAAVPPPARGDDGGQRLDEREAAQGAREVRLEYRLLVTGRFVPNEGLRIATVDPGGPGAWMTSPDNQRGILEPGDMITAIDGRRVHSLDEYYHALNASAGREGRVRLTVRDVRSGRETLWDTRAARVRVIGPPLPPVDRREPRVRVLLIGLTKDEKLGRMIEVSLAKLHTTFHGVPGIRDQDITELRGDQVTAENILGVVDRLAVRDSETLLCYYIGHGAYDPARVREGDRSGGHFFQIPSGDLMRRTLLDHLRAKHARLTVLLSDTCNVRSVAHPPPVYEHRQIFSGENRVLHDLLLNHTGVVDVSGSSRDQYGWFSLVPGGWFTEAFTNECDPENFRREAFVSWDRFLGRVSDAASKEFHRRKDSLLRAPGTTSAEVVQQLRQQADQRPQLFAVDVRRVP